MDFLGKHIEGIWHTSIVIFGKEYYFGQTGISVCEPVRYWETSRNKFVISKFLCVKVVVKTAYLHSSPRSFTLSSYSKNIEDKKCYYASNPIVIGHALTNMTKSVKN